MNKGARLPSPLYGPYLVPCTWGPTGTITVNHSISSLRKVVDLSLRHLLKTLEWEASGCLSLVSFVSCLLGAEGLCSEKPRPQGKISM